MEDHTRTVRLHTGDEGSRGAKPMEHEPGTSAPLSGVYSEVNIFGTPTGRRVYAAGRCLPSSSVSPINRGAFGHGRTTADLTNADEPIRSE